jgi:lipopolysaccharide transport system ATP-binding protein
MSDSVIKVENLSKQYRIGAKESYKTFRETLIDAAKAPIVRLGEAGRKVIRAGRLFSGSQLSAPPSTRSSQRDDLIWALKDISFEVKKGEVVGIIGRNGAGKSTLLKILSKITEPTKGRIELKGRIGSLLEVGTGFHPELTSHENIYLYGAILGMDRWEVTRKFDEIVAFAELEKFVDTPVKRYSSGMYMRLAFSVAAHLEPEILLVDEVLAVGDASFQKKCLGKMGEVSKEGRTVLFVSHNMTAISTLCELSLWLDHGVIRMIDDSQITTQAYLSSDSKCTETISFESDYTKSAQIKMIKLLDSHGKGTSEFDILSSINVEVIYDIRSNILNHRVGVVVSRYDGLDIFVTNSTDRQDYDDKIQPGMYIATLTIPSQLLAAGKYYLSVYLGEPNVKTHDRREYILSFGISGNPFRSNEKRKGLLVYPFSWKITNTNLT